MPARIDWQNNKEAAAQPLQKVSFSRHGQIYRSDGTFSSGWRRSGLALRPPPPIVAMSLQPAIPWRVALLHCPASASLASLILKDPVATVNSRNDRRERSYNNYWEFRLSLTGKRA
jgi:hypothetical protein